MQLLWWMRFKLDCIRTSLKRKHDPGRHRFVRGRCLCGQKTTDDHELCPINWKL